MPPQQVHQMPPQQQHQMPPPQQQPQAQAQKTQQSLNQILQPPRGPPQEEMTSLQQLEQVTMLPETIEHTPLPPDDLLSGHSSIDAIFQEEGTTSLTNIFDDKSLFEHQKELSRPRGTDARNSDHSDAYVAKRNSINQKVRSMSSDRSTTTPRGVGHETMQTSSLPVKPTFELEEIDAGDVLHEIPASAPIKKKMSIVDRAKEMAKNRGE